VTTEDLESAMLQKITDNVKNNKLIPVFAFFKRLIYRS
jgi:hypothetical protein